VSDFCGFLSFVHLTSGRVATKVWMHCFQSLDALFPKSGCAASKVRTGSIHWTEAGLLMDGKRDGIWGCLIVVWLTGAITRLQDYTLFFEPWVSETAYLYYIFI